MLIIMPYNNLAFTLGKAFHKRTKPQLFTLTGVMVKRVILDRGSVHYA
jgi:hypothetical protein